MTLLHMMAIAAPSVLAMALAASTGRAESPGGAAGAHLAKLAQRRIFFGHQSVGQDLVDGLRQLAASEGVALAAVETRDPALVRPGTLAHALVGRNGAPAEKLADFERLMHSGMAESVDVAFMKFCYVDVTPQTDVASLFDRYREVFGELKARYPRTTFVHITMPLTTIQGGKRAILKRMLGQPAGGVVENERREEFNALLRGAYAGKEPLFDLARAESTWPDGKVESVRSRQRAVPALVPAYTDDGGHLNSSARVHIARQLAAVLASAGLP